MIAANSSVRLDKLSEHNEGVLPTGYWCEGVILEEPIINHTIRLMRMARSRQRPEEPERVAVFGLYVSTPVQEILESPDGSVTCKTLNSIWRVTPIDPITEVTIRVQETA